MSDAAGITPDLPAACAVLQSMLQADPHNLDEHTRMLAQLVDVSWPADTAAQSLLDALQVVGLLALGLADALLRERGIVDPTPAQVSTLLVGLATGAS